MRFESDPGLLAAGLNPNTVVKNCHHLAVLFHVAVPGQQVQDVLPHVGAADCVAVN